MRKIADQLGVSTSSVSYWVRGIQIQPAHEQRNWEAHQGTAATKRRSEQWSRLCRERRCSAQAAGRGAATEGNSLHAIGCMLYWAEGTKDKNVLSFTNSDVNMVRTFVRFLRECLGVEDERIAIRLNAYTNNGLSATDIENFWLEAVELPRSQLLKSQWDNYPTSSSGARGNKLPYGCCTIRLRGSTPIVQHIFGAIQEYAGFEEPAWLG